MIRKHPVALGHVSQQTISQCAQHALYGGGPQTDTLPTHPVDKQPAAPDNANADFSASLSHVAVESISLPLLVVDHRPRIVFANRAMLQLARTGRNRMLGQHPFTLRSEGDAGPSRREIVTALHATGHWSGTIELRLPDHTTRSGFWLTIDTLKDSRANVIGHVAALCELDQLDPAYHEIRTLAYRDPLTGLVNRRWLLEQLDHDTQGKRRRRHPFALLFIDLDHFKSINDRLGHAVGDETLQTIATRLRTAIRTTDIAARLAGDEFVAVITNTDSLRDITATAQKILAAIARPLIIRDTRVNLAASIGVARFPADATDPASLLAKADRAMYGAKNHGGQRCRTYRSDH